MACVFILNYPPPTSARTDVNVRSILLKPPKGGRESQSASADLVKLARRLTAARIAQA